MNLRDFFIIIAAVITFLGGLSYFFDTLKGKTQPNRVTWFLWTVAPMIAFFAQLSKGVGLSTLLTFMVGFNPAMIFFASFMNKRAVWKLQFFDYFCGFWSLLALIFWQITQEANIAIIFSIVADFFAAIPTLIKAYRSPYSESYLIYLSGVVSFSLTLLALSQWRFEDYIFPLYILGINAFLFLIITVRRIVVRKSM